MNRLRGVIDAESVFLLLVLVSTYLYFDGGWWLNRILLAVKFWLALLS